MTAENFRHWVPGNKVTLFVSHLRMDADEHFIFAINSVFPDAVAKTFPAIGAASFGYISSDEHIADSNIGGPHTIFVGVGKGPRVDIFDEHEEINGKECAATKMVSKLRLNKLQRRAIKRSLREVLFEEKNGTEMAQEIPGMVKQLHDTELYSEEQVRGWSALAYAAQIREDFQLAEKDELLESYGDKKGWQLCVGIAVILIRRHFGDKKAEWFLGMAEAAMGFTLTLKEQAKAEIKRVRNGKHLQDGEQSVWVDHTRVGDVPLLAIVTNNRWVQSEALNKGGFGIVIVKNPETGNVNIAMDRRKHWCSCDVCARLRDKENELRGRSVLTDMERYSHDSVLACPEWNRFQEAPYATNGTLKHCNVEPTVLNLDQVVHEVKKGITGRFRCPDWNSHGWIYRDDTERKQKQAAEEQKREQQRQYKVAEVDRTIELIYSAAEQMEKEFAPVFEEARKLKETSEVN